MLRLAAICCTSLVLATGLPSRGRAAAMPASAATPAATTAKQGTAKPGPGPRGPSEGIVAIVNGDVISQADVEARARLFALSTGMPVSPEVLSRLRPQVTRQLVDERLRLQEQQRRKIVISDKQIATAISEIESRSGMPNGALRAQLGAQGVALRTLIDQVRVQLGWQQVLRDELGDKAQISDADVAEQQAILKAQSGAPEFHVSEIFLPVEDPSKAAETQRFAESVAAQLRTGASFPVIAAQFSQSQTALQGGDLGWLQANQLDPQVAAVVTQMPDGAISNPIKLPGGFIIVALNGRRAVGRDVATMVSLRQVFLPFTATLNPAAPTDQQKKQLELAGSISKTVHGCDAMEAANKANNSPRPADPGELRQEGLSGPMRTLLATLKPGDVSRPLVSPEGISLVMICSRGEQNLAETGREAITTRLVNERVELISRQMQRDLRRRALIDMRG